MYKKCVVPVDRLKKDVNLSKFKFNTTEEISPLVTVIGQDRAVRAIDFALLIGGSFLQYFCYRYPGDRPDNHCQGSVG